APPRARRYRGVRPSPRRRGAGRAPGSIRRGCRPRGLPPRAARCRSGRRRPCRKLTPTGIPVQYGTLPGHHPHGRNESSMGRTMKAAIFSATGGPEVVEVRDDVPVPEPGPGEVRLAVQAAAMNHLDLWVRRGLPVETTMPHIGGSDVAGTVEAVGPGVEGVAEGARVVVDPSIGYGWYDTAAVGGGLAEPHFRILGEHT